MSFSFYCGSIPYFDSLHPAFEETRSLGYNPYDMNTLGNFCCGVNRIPNAPGSWLFPGYFDETLSTVEMHLARGVSCTAYDVDIDNNFLCKTSPRKKIKTVQDTPNSSVEARLWRPFSLSPSPLNVSYMNSNKSLLEQCKRKIPTEMSRTVLSIKPSLVKIEASQTSVFKPYKKFNHSTHLACEQSTVHIAYHAKQATGSNAFQCSHPARSEAVSEMEEPSHHAFIQSGLKPYSCNVCGKTFAGKEELSHHSFIHSGLKPCCCNVCGKTFARKEELSRHSFIHSGLKPYSCNVCGKTFARKEEMCRHSRIHSGLKPHSCSVCGKTFGRRDHLSKHLKTHLQVADKKVHRCQGCGHSYTRSDALARHKASAHSTTKTKNH